MKYLKMFGLLAVAMAALMAFAGTAAATLLTSSQGPTPTIKALSTNATLHNAVGTISCESFIEGTVQNHGPGKPVSGKVDHLTFGPCVGGSVHNASIKSGELSVTALGAGDGTVTSSGATVMVTMFGVECGYTTEGTHIGTLTDGEHAILDITASLKRTEGSGGVFCDSTANLTGSYRVNSPTNLAVDI